MTPEEREKSEQDYLAEYQEALACLAILNRRLADMARRFAQLNNQLSNDFTVDAPDGLHEELTAFVPTLNDYRATRERALALYETLRPNLADAIQSVRYPQR